MKPLAVYGTLRKGDYNYYAFQLRRKTKFLGRGIVKGYTMFNMGGYPGAIYFKGDKNKFRIIVDVLRFKDKKDRLSIDNMEVKFGYHLENVNVEMKDGSIIKSILYAIDRDLLSYSHGHILKGDWIKYKERLMGEQNGK